MRIVSYLKLSIVILIFLACLAAVWLIDPVWQLDNDELLSYALIIRILMSVIIIITTLIIGYLLLRTQNNDTLARQQQETAQRQQSKHSKKVYAKKIAAFYYDLKISFQHAAGKQYRLLKRQPWFLCMGDTQAGKMTLLKSFTETALGEMSDKNDKRPFQWHTSSQAVFLNIQHTNDQLAENNHINNSFCSGLTSDSPLLLAVLKLVRRWRRFSAINGIIVVIDLPKLIVQTDIEIQQWRHQLLTIFTLMQQQLKISMPVYFVLNKCDLIVGFNEFFTELSKEEQQQVWGINFAYQTFESQAQANSYFNKEYTKLIERLNERLVAALSEARAPETRQLISYFPQQMALARQAIHYLVMHDNTVNTRGIYFTSNKIGGRACDFVMSTLAIKYGLPQKNYQYPEIRKSHFVQSLFPVVLQKEALLIQQSPYFHRLQAIKHHFNTILFSILVTFSLIGFISSYIINSENMDTIARYLPDYQQENLRLSPNDRNLSDTLPLLNTLKTIQQIYTQADHPWLQYFAFYQPLQINSAIQEIWRRTLATTLMPRIAERLAAILASNQNNPIVLYKALKGYLVFGPNENTNPAWIIPPMNDDWSISMANRPEMQAQLNDFLRQAIIYPIDTLPLNENLIAQTREHLRSVPPAEFAYEELKSQALQDNNDVLRLNEQLDDNFSQVFACQNSNNCRVPNLYTLMGFLSLRGKQAKLIVNDTAQVYRVLGLDQNATNDMLVQQMTPQLWADYSDDYITIWNTVLNNITIVPFVNYTQAVQVLNTLVQKNNPLLQTLALIKGNTDTVRGKNLTIAKAFATINTLSGLPDKPSPSYTLLIQNLTALRDYLNTYSNSTDSSAQAFQDAVAILQNKAPTNPLVVLKVEAQQLPEPLSHWVNQIVANSYALLLQGAHQYIAMAWQNNVVPVYQSDIENRFPFTSSTDSFVSLASFGNFFGYQGTIDQFTQTYLQGFINQTQTNWLLNTFAGHTLPMSSQVLNALQQAAMIKKMYFPNNDKGPSVEFSLQPHDLDAQSSSITIQLGNQQLTYRHGPLQPVNWHWPMSGDVQQVNYAFSDFQNNSQSQTFDTPWAWFKLLTATQLQSAGTPGHYIWTIKQQTHRASFDLWTANTMPVFDLARFNTFSLPNNI